MDQETYNLLRQVFTEGYELGVKHGHLDHLSGSELAQRATYRFESLLNKLLK